MNLYHINSTPNTDNSESSEKFNFNVICDNNGRLKEALEDLKQESKNFEITSGKA